MKVAFLAPEFLPPRGGVGVYSVSLVKELSKNKDLEIHVIAPKRGKSYTKERILKYFDNRIKLHLITEAKGTVLYNLWFQLKLFHEFRLLHKKYDFDLVNCANLVHMPDIFLMLEGHRMPHLVTAHTTIKGQVKGFTQGGKNFF